MILPQGPLLIHLPGIPVIFPVKIRSLAYGGALVAERSDGLPSKKVFVRGGIPGELIRVEMVNEEKNLIHGRLVSIEEPSPDRVSPPCPYFGECGGCDLQHMNIATERRIKVEMVESMLHRQGRLVPSQGVKLLDGALPEYNYRRRISLHLDQSGRLGFYRAGTGDVVDTPTCLLAEEGVNEILAKIRPLVSRWCEVIGGVVIERREGGGHQIVLRVREEYRFHELRERSSAFDSLFALSLPLFFSFGGRNFEWVGESFEQSESAAGHFSQVNERGNELLVKSVCGHIRFPEVYDLYAGAGNFSFPLSERAKRVTAVEADPALVRVGRARVRSRSLEEKIEFIDSSCERFIRSGSPRGSVVLDPPRSGAKVVCEALRPGAVKEIIYVSCNLPSLTRDLQILVRAGWSLESVEVLDMFPRTHHVETISVLRAG